MTRRSAIAGIAFLMAALGLVAYAADPPPPPPVPPPAAVESPRESGLIEETGRRIVQIDVSVRGSRRALSQIVPEDFEVIIAGHPLEDFVVDSQCPAAEPAAAPAPRPAEPDPGVGQAEPPAPVPLSGPPASYLLYFEQNQLTMAGRAEAFDMSRELIPALLASGGRVTIVSSGEDLRTFAELGSSETELLAALDEIEKDRKQFSTIAMEEPAKIREILDLLEENELDRARSMARLHQREEAWRSERSLRRFAIVLGRFADLDPPKVALYFADTMRSNPGEHFLSFFGNLDREKQALRNAAAEAFLASNAFETLLDEAVALGIRVYAIQAEGLTADATGIARGGIPRAGRSASANEAARRDAQDTLVRVARETGGQAFLNGVRTARIAEAIEEDLGCLYLISFDAGALPQDRTLPLVVRVHREGVRADARGRLVVQSDKSRLTSRLLAAFATPETSRSTLPLRSAIIPTGFEDGLYTALVQIVSEGSPLTGTSWDVGLSLVARGKVADQASGRITISGSRVAVVFEKQVTLRPGPWEIVAVAHESTGDDVASTVLDGDWPDPEEVPAMVAPISVMQPVPGVFLRDEDVRRSGALALDDKGLADVRQPTAFVALVCGPRASAGRVTIERRLVGDTIAPFGELDLGADGQSRCTQVRDLVPAGTLSEGEFRYEVRVVGADGAELATGTRTFFAQGLPAAPTGSDATPPAAGSAR